MTEVRSAIVLRRAFDQSFADAPRDLAAKFDDYLALRLDDDAYLLPIADLSGLVAHKRIVPLPGHAPAFVGVVGARGALVPVYDLAQLLGYPPASGELCWLALARAAVVGLAFDRLTSHVRRPTGERVAAAGTSPQPHVRDALRIAEVTHRIVDVASIVAKIARHARMPTTTEER